MEARARSLLLFIVVLPALGASSRTRNFVVTAPTPALAREIATSAERYRRELAQEWLGQELPDWATPCPLTAHVSPSLGAGGRTSFMFRNRMPFGWEMEIQGSRERILDSVLPHEVTHTIFATHFGRPLPRWADEGACTTVEHPSERKKQEQWLVQFLKTRRGIPFNRMFAMTEYPGDILPLYSQGYSVARFLIAQGGKPKFVAFVGDGLDTGDWTHAVQSHYGFPSLGSLQLTWVDWVIDGSREELAGSAPDAAIRLASNATPTATATTPVASPTKTPSAESESPRQLAMTDRTSPLPGSVDSWYARRKPATRDQVVPQRSQLGADGWRSEPIGSRRQ